MIVCQLFTHLHQLLREMLSQLLFLSFSRFSWKNWQLQLDTRTIKVASSSCGVFSENNDLNHTRKFENLFFDYTLHILIWSVVFVWLLRINDKVPFNWIKPNHHWHLPESSVSQLHIGGSCDSFCYHIAKKKKKLYLNQTDFSSSRIMHYFLTN